MQQLRGGVPYYKFSSRHVKQWAELDGIEAEGWLKRDNDHYFVHSTIVLEMNTPAARQRLPSNQRRVWAVSL